MTKPTSCGAACACGGSLSSLSVHTRDGAITAGVFTTEALGEQQSITPEGFLLCEEVVIARAGSMDYAAIELPEIEDKDGVIVVDRTPEVLFAPEVLASFEGKPVTIDHPSEPVNPATWAVVAKGVAKNVRRGDGDKSDLMLADLLIMDAEAIRRVRAKELVEISNGYDAKYEQIAPGRARQVTIVGNHVALVKNARCGPVCSVRDSSDNLKRGMYMAKTKGAVSIKDTLRKLFMTKDSEGFEKALSNVTEDEEGDAGSGGDGKEVHVHVNLPSAGAATAPVEKTGDEEPPAGGDAIATLTAAVNKVADAVTAIGERVTKLESGGGGGGATEGHGDDITDDDDDELGGGGSTTTGDSAGVSVLFQEARARAEILAPGVNLPTYDAKAPLKKTADSLCVLRRRALRASLATPNADLVKSVLAGADIKKMTCDSAAVVFNAASELVKVRNSQVGQHHQSTNDGVKPQAFADINERNRAFWKRS